MPWNGGMLCRYHQCCTFLARCTRIKCKIRTNYTDSKAWKFLHHFMRTVVPLKIDCCQIIYRVQSMCYIFIQTTSFITITSSYISLSRMFLLRLIALKFPNCLHSGLRCDLLQSLRSVNRQVSEQPVHWKLGQATVNKPDSISCS